MAAMSRKKCAIHVGMHKKKKQDTLKNNNRVIIY